MANTVKIKKYSDVVEEILAHEAIKPGHLVQLMDSGRVCKHAGESENALPMFALEDELQGKTIDQDYAQHDPVQVWVAGRGDIVNALLKGSENVVIGDWLVSGGDGTLQKYNAAFHSAGDDVHPLKIVAQALQASNEATVQRIAVRIV